MIFFKIVFINFIFLILSWLRITITIKLNHVGKHCNFPHKILWIATVFFLMSFFSKLSSLIFFNIELVENLVL